MSATDISAGSIYDTLVDVLLVKNYHYINYYNQSADAYRIERERLSGQQTFTLSPASVNWGTGGFVHSISAGYEYGDWQAQCGIDNSIDKREALRAAISVPLFTSKRVLRTIYDTLINLETTKARHEIELRMLSDTRHLVSLCAELNMLEAERDFRKEIAFSIDSLYVKLTRMEKNGILSGQMVRNFSLLASGNQISLMMLDNRISSLAAQTAKEFLVSENSVRKLCLISDSLCRYLKENRSRQSTGLLSENPARIIDSLSWSITNTTTRMSLKPVYEVSLGPTFRKDLFYKDYEIGIQCNISLQTPLKISPKNQIRIQPVDNAPVQSTPKNVLPDKVNTLSEGYQNETRAMIQSAYREMQLGNVTSLYTIIDCIDKSIQAQMQIDTYNYQCALASVEFFASLRDFPFYELFIRRTP
jgi:hypothetical protein